MLCRVFRPILLSESNLFTLMLILSMIDYCNSVNTKGGTGDRTLSRRYSQKYDPKCFKKIEEAGHEPVPCPVQRLTALYTQLFCGLLCNANAVCMNSLTASATFGLSLRIINAAKLSIPSSSFIQTVCME